jgi:hypothetical protein
VIARATLVCCDSLEDARLESGDLIEPIAAGSSTGSRCRSSTRSSRASCRAGRPTTDVVVFKSNGIAPWDLAIGHEVLRRARERGSASSSEPSSVLAEDDLLRALPEELLAELAQVLVAFHDGREVVARELSLPSTRS